MKAYFISKLGFKVVVEPPKKATKEDLEKRVRLIMRKRGIESEIVFID
jgi:hypothetical protein